MGDCIAECGFGCFIPRKNLINYHLALASIASAFLGIMGCVSYNNVADSMNNSPWITATLEDKEDFLFGLSGYALKDADKTVYNTIAFNDETKCTEDFCGECFDLRGGVLAALIVGLLFGFLSFACSMKRTFSDASVWKDMGIVVSALAFACGCAAYNMYRPCFDSVDSFMTENAASLAISDPSFSGEVEVKYGSGAKQVLASFVLALYISVFNLFIPIASSDVDDEDDK